MAKGRIWTMEIKADPTQEQATALTRQFRANLKRKGVTHLQAVPFVSAAVTPYQWRMRGVRILGYYDIGPFKDEGFYLRADAVERA